MIERPDPFMWFLYDFGEFSHMCVLIHIQLNTKKQNKPKKKQQQKNPSPIQAPFYLGAVLFSPLICPGNAVSLGFRAFLLQSPLLRKTTCFYLSILSLYRSLETLLSVSLGPCKDYFICFPLLGDNYSFLLDVQCLKNYWFKRYLHLLPLHSYWKRKFEMLYF